MKEPVSSITSLAYTGVGILTLASHEITITTGLLGIALVLLGMFSFEFHVRGSVKNDRYHRADEGSMYAVSLFLLSAVFPSVFQPMILLGSSFVLGIILLNLDHRLVNSSVLIPSISAATIAGLFIFHGVSLLTALPGIVMGASGVIRMISEEVESRWIEDTLHGLFWHYGTAFAVWIIIERILI